MNLLAISHIVPINLNKFNKMIFITLNKQFNIKIRLNNSNLIISNKISIKPINNKRFYYKITSNKHLYFINKRNHYIQKIKNLFQK